MPVLGGFSPLSPLYVSPDLETLHTGALPGCSVYASKRSVLSLSFSNQHFDFCWVFYCFLVPLSDVRRSRGDADQATKTGGGER